MTTADQTGPCTGCSTCRAATTPGDDRGRELLRSIVDVFTDGTGAFQFEIVERPGDPQSPSRCVSLADAVRALAAPAETEAGDRITDWPERPSNEAIARMFHEEYERLAPLFGYRTREESAKPWDEVPETNRLLMGATVGGVMIRLFGDAPDDPDPLAATPPAPEGEAGSVPSREDVAALVANLEDVHGNAEDEDDAATLLAAMVALRKLDRARTPAPAGPQAEGAGGSR